VRPLAGGPRSPPSAPPGSAATGPDPAWIFARGKVANLNVEPTPASGEATAMAAAIADSLVAAPHARMFVTYGAEMNGNWTDWGCRPAAQYIAQYRAFHAAVTDALDARGIDLRRVRWAYGPNATSSASCGSAAGYYPGHAYVDFLGMSAYRPNGATVTASVLAPMSALFEALDYPEAWRTDRFLILQTGARAAADRASWLASLFSAAREDERIGGLIYFDAADWAAPPSDLDAALAAAPVADAALDGLFTPHFIDVPYTHPAFHEIQALRDAGITSGCASSPPRFCPDEILTPEAATALVERALGTTVTFAEPVTERALAEALPSSDVAAADSPVTRAAAAVIIAHAAALRPHAL